MSNQAINWAIKQREIRNAEKMVLIMLANRANKQNQCWPSHRSIADDAGICVTTVKRALTSLRKRGLLHWQQRLSETKEFFDSNLYTLHLEAEPASQAIPSTTDTEVGPERPLPPPAAAPSPLQKLATPPPETSSPLVHNELPPSAIMGEETKDDPSMKPNRTREVITCRVGSRVGEVVCLY